MKKLIATCFIMLLFLGLFMGRTVFTSMATEELHAEPYYKSIQIREGDNLWTIAAQYKDKSSMTTSDYVNCLIRMNSLKNDTIHTGQHLTVVYFQ